MLFIGQHKLAMLISADQQESALDAAAIATAAFIENKLQARPIGRKSRRSAGVCSEK